MKLKKVLALTLAGIMTVGLAACGGTKESSEKTEAGKEKQKLVIWSWGADEEKKSREAAVEAFQKAHPEIEVEHSVIPTADHVWDQKMTAALSAGTGPDVIQMSPDYYGLYTDYYEDLNPYVEKEGVDLDSVVTEGMMDPYYRPDGKLEGKPLLQNCFVLAYNKDMFDEFGVEYPTAEWTWDDVAEAAKKFAGGEGADATFGIVNHWIDPPLSIICKGGNAYSDDLSTCEIDSQEVRDGLDLFGDMIQSGAMPDDTAAKSLPKEQLFVSGHAAMYTLGGFETKLIAEEIGENFNWDVVSMPKVPDGGKNNLLYATGYAMLKDSENKDAAWAWIKTMTSNEDYLVNGLANTWGDFPGYIPAIERCIEEGHTDIVTGDQQYFADFYETAKNVKGDPMTKYDRQAWASATAQMDLIATGQTTPEEAVEGFKEEMKNIYPEIEID